jgi:hypothetical protein
MESPRLIRHPSAALLAVQLLGVLLYPFMENTPTGRALFGTFGLVVLAMALWVVRRSPWLTWLGLLLAAPVAVLSMVNAYSPAPWLAALTALMEATFYFYATGSLIAYMFHDRFVTTDEFYAAGATFTLLAWAFAYLYVACQIFYPGSFGAQLNADQPRTWVELLFLSFATLSSVGQGDIIPLSPMARALTMIEQVAGVMYIMLVLSRLVALSQYRTFRPRGRHPHDIDDSRGPDQ